MLAFGRRVLGWAVLLTALAALGVAVVVPRLAGATPFTVLTGSMEPTLAPGTLVVVRPVAAEHIALGTVITYQLRSGDPTTVTHRVVGKGFDGEGDLVFVTQGDANDVEDAARVRPEQIRGELWYAVPYLGRVGSLLTTRQREVIVTGTAIALFGYALLMFVGALRARLRRRTRVVVDV